MKVNTTRQNILFTPREDVTQLNYKFINEQSKNTIEGTTTASIEGNYYNIILTETLIEGDFYYLILSVDNQVIYKTKVFASDIKTNNYINHGSTQEEKYIIK